MNRVKYDDSADFKIVEALCLSHVLDSFDSQDTLKLQTTNINVDNCNHNPHNPHHVNKR